MKVYILILILVNICVLPVFTLRRQIRQADDTATTQINEAVNSHSKTGKTCFGPDKLEGVCKELKECSTYLNLLRGNPKDSVFIQFLRDSNVVCNKVYSHVCCPVNDETIKPSRAVPSTITVFHERLRREISNNHLPTIADGCGRRNKKPGEVGSQPWLALLGYDGVHEGFKCDGTLITSKHVLTAALCIVDDLKFIRLGEHNTDSDDETHHIDISIEKVEKHPNFSNHKHIHDIAIIYLEKSVSFTEFIRPICLPDIEPVKSKSYIGNKLIVAGWGRTDNSGEASKVIREFPLLLRENSFCKGIFNVSRDFSPENFGDNLLCAGVSEDGEEDACQGFAGAPLMVSEKIDDIEYFFELGLASFGVSCGRVQAAGAYTNVKYYLDWIKEKIASHENLIREISNNHLPTIADGCGRRNKKPGEVGSQPWLALLGYDGAHGGFNCDGTLITSKHVLTAALCIVDDLKFIRLGEHNTESDDETQHIDISIEKVEKHPNFSNHKHIHDIAIIYLEKSVSFTEFIRPICLPKIEPVKSKSYIGNKLIVAGWGRTDNSGEASKVIREFPLLLRENSFCKGIFNVSRDFSPENFGDNLLCAGVSEDGEEDACQGFAGAPLMVSEKIDDIEYFFELGLLSFGLSCGRVREAGAYTNVKYYLDWIEEKIGRISIPPPIITRPTTEASNTHVRLSGKTCFGPDAVEGFCTELKQCPVLSNRLKANPTDAAFAKFLRQSNTLCDNVYSQVCCPSEDKNGGKSGENENGKTFINTLPTPQDGCGLSNHINLLFKISGGVTAKLGAWPWAALLGYSTSDGIDFKCGGALISSRHVLTAAHCIRNDLQMVRLGEHDLKTDTETQHLDVTVSRTEKHADYSRRDGFADIAIVYLERNVPFTNTIKPICLPQSSSLRFKSYVDFSPFAVGWGKTQEGGQSATVLQELQIPVHNNTVCINSYAKKSRYISRRQFGETVLCAGVLEGGKDTCQGDSGGPLMITEPIEGKLYFFELGVVSYGIGCTRADIPGVYTSVQYYMDWIQQKVAETT